MKLIINANHKARDTDLCEWERLAFYNLVVLFRKKLLSNPQQTKFRIDANILKCAINFVKVSEGKAYTKQYKKHFDINEDSRKYGVINQLFDLIGYSLNYGMELKEHEKSTRFFMFSSVNISHDLRTFIIEISNVFHRLLLDHYTLLIYHDCIKAGLTDLVALEVFNAMIQRSNDFVMIITIEEADEYEDLFETYMLGIEEINAKTEQHLCIEPIISNGQSIALQIREN